jgi:hypothetical protein
MRPWIANRISSTRFWMRDAGATKFCAVKFEDLLAAHRVAGEFIETPVGDLARSSIGDGHEGDLLVGQIIGHYKILRTDQRRRNGRGLPR